MTEQCGGFTQTAIDGPGGALRRDSDLTMLSALFIRNIVLIEQLDLEFGPGLCVLSGETGAG
ncbi:MAG: hypothetical protein C0605_09305, partial [Hyphomicrobiales bacterium]